MDPRFFRKYTDLIIEAEQEPSEEQQLYTLTSAMGKRNINATPTKAKKIARNLMMQQQLGDWFTLTDGEGNTVLKHGNEPQQAAKPADAPHKPSNTPDYVPGNEPEPEAEEDPDAPPKKSFYDFVHDIEDQNRVDQELASWLRPKLTNKDDEDNVIDGEYEVIDDEPKQIAAREGKFEAPNKSNVDYTRFNRKPSTGEREFPGPWKASPDDIKRGYPLNKSHTMKDGLIYMWNDPRLKQS